MPSIAAIVLRCLLVLALVLDGGLAFAIDVAGTGDAATSGVATPDRSPCHADADRDPERQPVPDDAPDCCAAQCDCGCVTSPVLFALASIPLAVGPTGMAAPRITNLFVMPASPRLLRPPI